MSITRFGKAIPLLNAGLGSTTQIPAGGTSGQVITANGSNGAYWGENVARITANGSNTVAGPFVNFAAGSNVILAVSSNTLTIASSGTGGGGSSFTPPASVDGLWTWLKADAITGLVDNDPVVQWENSVPGFGFAARAHSTQPVYKTGVLNGLPVVRFGGATWMYLFSYALTAPNYCYFIVFKLSSIANAYSGILGNNVNADGGGFFIKSNGTSAVYPGTGTAYDGTGSATYNTTDWNYFVDNHGQAQSYKTRRNGVDDAASTTLTGAGSSLFYHQFLGSQSVGGRVFSGDIAEVLIYARALSSSEITSVEGYITAKYGL